MAEPYIGEIRMFGGNFAPAGWAFCNGQLLQIASNDALFALIGTTYGGDGAVNFALPDLRGRLPVHQASGFAVGQAGGSEQVTLTPGQIPSHNHALPCQSLAGSQTGPGNASWANARSNSYSAGAANVQMGVANIGLNTPSNQPHDNMMPFLAVSFIISLFGIFPSPN